ncbi:MAG: sigma-54-dependent transcriptional regulator [Sphaerochaetaceae bacterium]|jgi:DNA-binding NtrC family response regulator
MALYLVSKDGKLKGSLDRQLTYGCNWINSPNRLKDLMGQIKNDFEPIFLIDENFNERGGFYPILELLLSYKVRGSKILLTNKLNNSLESTLFIEGDLGLLYKPFSVVSLVETLAKMGKGLALIEHIKKESLQSLCKVEDLYKTTLVGKSAAMFLVRKVIAKVSPNFNSIHINGESGTGKEVVANLIKMSCQNKGPFIPVNCSAIPTTLADTYLFGNVKGAFTDAKEQREGVVAAANGGILFLDEIEDLSLEVQGKLLRLLESYQFRPVGSVTMSSSNFRLITASNIPLTKLVKEGSLRYDLYNRINQVVINLPPLRKHKEDIPLLIEHYYNQIGESRSLDEETFKMVMSYSWPGNVRELFKELNLLSVFAPSEVKHLSFREILTESALFTPTTEQLYSLVSEPELPFNCNKITCG